VLEGIVFRYRTGCAWRDLPAEFGPWQTVWKRHHRFSTDGTWDRIPAALQAKADAAGQLDWRVSVDSSISRVHQHGATAARTEESRAVPRGARWNYTNRLTEPADHGIGRSRGGLSTKTHLAVDGSGRPLVILIGPGQGGDSPMFAPLLAAIRVPRIGPGRPRTRPAAVLADKAYSARAHRAALRERGIAAVIPEPADQAAHRRHPDSAGGR
jgi:transposase